MQTMVLWPKLPGQEANVAVGEEYGGKLIHIGPSDGVPFLCLFLLSSSHQNVSHWEAARLGMSAYNIGVKAPLPESVLTYDVR